MAQDDTNKSAETYPFVTGANYTDTENREYATTPLSSTGINTDAEEDVTDEVRAARADVENTRAELSGTIDALKEKLSPANLVAEAKEATFGAAQTAVNDAVDSAKETAHNVVDTAKEVVHTVADTAKDVAISAAGAVQGAASTVVSSISSAVDSAKTAVTGAVDTAKSAVSGAVDSAKSAVSGAAHNAGEAAKSATHSVAEVSHNVGSTAKGAGATIVDIIRLNPIPAAITGIGLGWLIMSIRRQNKEAARYGVGTKSASADRYVSGTDEYGQSSYATTGYGSSYGSSTSSGPSAIDAAKGKLGEVKDSVAYRASDIASSVTDKATDLASTASGLASTVSDKAGDFAHTVSDRASALGTQAKDTAQSAVQATGNYITTNPLAAGAIALLLGATVGLLIPSTDKENELLGETRDRLKDQAAEQLHQVADKVTNVAHTAFDSAKQTVKDEAQSQGLTGTPA